MKILERRVFPAFVCLCLCVSVQVKGSNNPFEDAPRDSLEKWLPSLRGMDRLLALECLIDYTFNSDTPAAARYVEAMYTEGMAQKEYKYAIFALLKQMQQLAEAEDYPGAIRKLEEAEQLSEEVQRYNYYAYIQGTLVQLHTKAGDFANALRKAEKMYDYAQRSGGLLDMYEAAEMIGLVYERMNMFPDALKYYNEALRHNREYEKARHRFDSSDIYHEQRNAGLYGNLADVYYAMGDHEKVELYADSMSSSIRRSVETKEHPSSYYDKDRFVLEFYYGYSALKKGDVEKGREHLERMKESFNPEWVFSENRVEMLDALYFYYYEATGDYPRALAYCEKRIDFFRRQENRMAVADNLIVKAGLEQRMGDFRAAAETYAQHVELSRQLEEREYYSQLHELRTVYELDKAELQAGQERLRFLSARNLAIGLSGILALVVAIVVIMVVNRRRLQAKNKGLFAQIENQDSLSREIDRWKEEAMRLRVFVSPVDGDSADTEREDVFYTRLKELTNDPAVYTDPELTRKSLAGKLGTNERYLFDLIKKYFDMGFTEYILTLRLGHARRLLSDPSGRYTVEAAAIDSGFGSRVTLHRHFKARYGLTPDEFRNLSREMTASRTA